jgi:hypothetical protein
LVSDFAYLSSYFTHPQYLKIDDRPCVTFDYTLPFRGDIKAVFAELRDRVREKGWNLFLVNDLAGRSEQPGDLISGNAPWHPNLSPAHVVQVIESTDAMGGGPPGHAKRFFEAWRSFALKYKKDYVPAIWPGQHYHPSVCPTCEPIGPRSPELFRSLLDAAMQNGTKRTVEIRAFNEWEAGIQIEPAEEYGFEYLNTLKESLPRKP